VTRSMLKGVPRALGAATLAATAVAAFAGPAVSATTAAEYLNQFNLVVFDNAQLGQDIEGRAYVGGNVTGRSFQVNTRNADALAPSSYDELNVGFNVSLSGNQISLQKGGDASIVGNGAFNAEGSAAPGGSRGTYYIGGTHTGTNNFNMVQKNLGAATVMARLPADIESTLTAASSQLAGESGTALTKTGNSLVITASDPYNVFSLDGALLSQNTLIGYDFDIAGTSDTVVVNVSGQTLNLKDKGINFGGFPDQVAQSTNVLWNFFEATSLTLGPQWLGSILAPFAQVSNQTPIEGALVARSFVQGGEMHIQPFAGTVSAVPLPPSLLLFISALVGLGLVGYSRRGRSRAG